MRGEICTDVKPANRPAACLMRFALPESPAFGNADKRSLHLVSGVMDIRQLSEQGLAVTRT